MADPKPAEGEIKPDPTSVDVQQLEAYRSQRDMAIRRVAAYETILKHHNISTATVTPDRLETLPIKDGVIDGKFEYAPPPPKVKEPPAKPTEPGKNGGGEMTLDDVQKMSREQVNSDWENVSAVLAASA